MSDVMSQLRGIVKHLPDATLQEVQMGLEAIRNQDSLEAASLVESFFEESPDLLAIRDFRSDLYVINRQWERVLGWGADELKDVCRELVHEEDVDILAFLDRESENSDFQIVNRLRNKDGTYTTLCWNVRTDRNLVFCSGRPLAAHCTAFCTPVPKRSLKRK